jgi:tRNA-2-methylthio-N6-dimethylallyladenosine synthase
MRRDHTVEEYLELIDELKSEVPDVSLTTDIIVGFPGEADAQFQDTLKVMERVGYSSSFMFSYSPRPGTPANEFEDSVPEDVKSRRLQEIIQLQNRLTEEQGRFYKGKTIEILIEGNSGKPGYSFKGRNPQYWRVNTTGGEGLYKPGDRVQVHIEQTSGHGLRGAIQ